MIIGTGIDIVEITRMEEMLSRQDKILARVLTPTERQLLPQGATKRVSEYVAGRFAAKEAVAKAIGSGIGKVIGFHDIEILPDEAGKPHVHIRESALKKAYPQRTANLRFHLSISHSRTFAIAQVVIEEI